MFDPEPLTQPPERLSDSEFIVESDCSSILSDTSNDEIEEDGEKDKEESGDDSFIESDYEN
jgi:hypothetical protein